MDRKTTQFLNALNRRFYAAQAHSFSETRGAAWPGWERLLPKLRAPLSVLDLGCGNGRFFAFLKERLVGDFAYRGVDASTELLAIARANFAQDAARAAFHEADLVESDREPVFQSGAWDLIVAFGLLHHIPGFENRAAFLLEAAGALRADGLLAVTFWQFGKFERFQRKLVPWPTPCHDASRDRGSEALALAPQDLQLEAGDLLLSWGAAENVLRYCHFAEDSELDRLQARLEAAGFFLADSYCTDGETGDLNRYWWIAAKNSPAFASRP